MCFNWIYITDAPVKNRTDILSSCFYFLVEAEAEIKK